ncbi:MAG TPA: Uma2 family endonuclease [Thermoanaerobaculia bacterium]|nr:Uma2 family endonuclease [Thermoanaerobaculia bacterium]
MMITRSQSPRLTYQDLLRLPDDLLRHELIDGEHYVSPAPTVKHQDIVLNLVHILLTFVRAHGLGKVMVGPVDVLFTEHDVVEPDVLFVAAAHGDRVRERYVAGAPDLVVEVLSPSNRGFDRIKKRRLYDAQGVPEYWIVDPGAETVEVYRALPRGGPLERHALLSVAGGDTLETPLLSALRIPLREVFE